jgi:hypothetical protein
MAANGGKIDKKALNNAPPKNPIIRISSGSPAIIHAAKKDLNKPLIDFIPGYNKIENPTTRIVMRMIAIRLPL